MKAREELPGSAWMPAGRDAAAGRLGEHVARGPPAPGGPVPYAGRTRRNGGATTGAAGAPTSNAGPSFPRGRRARGGPARRARDTDTQKRPRRGCSSAGPTTLEEVKVILHELGDAL